jgi:hypothetical protein
LANNIIVANTSCIGNNTLGLFTFHFRRQQKNPTHLHREFPKLKKENYKPEGKIINFCTQHFKESGSADDG